MNIEKLKGEFSICSLSDFSEADLSRPFCFAARTDQEYSLVCPSDRVPEHTKKESRGWRAFRVQGTMELSLIGILAGISSILASEGINIFVVSTYDTDYILVKEDRTDKAAAALETGGWTVLEHEV
ncbi:MAG TPA: ACT domain-containing protein [Veillonellaceae bacterium]|jgi:hypothetical protein|nr:ACT domain-containing protein [Veillonellaceae bacterium]